MIHVRPAAEPPSFDANVRQPGQIWLRNHPVAKKGETWEPFWQKCLPDLRLAYKGICAYYGCRVEEASGAQSVDHYLPKSKFRLQAYEWNNYRFACSRMNARKHDGSNVLDPFQLVDGWFVLEFATMSVHANAALVGHDLKRVIATRDRLKLNSAECIRERVSRWEVYEKHGASAQCLIENAPFIALEAVRQGKLRPADSGITAANIRAWLDS